MHAAALRFRPCPRTCAWPAPACPAPLPPQGLIHYVEVDIVEDADIAEAAGVSGTPTVQFFKDKSRVVSAAGVKMKREYREMISAHIGVEAKVQVPA